MKPFGWEKLGRIYEAPNLHPKLCSHAANPLPVHLQGDDFRVFFSGRDAENRSSVGWFDLNLETAKVIEVCHEPTFVHGDDDSFYSHGVSIGNCYEAGGQRYILFMGWRQPPHDHWRGEIGRLRLTDNFALRLDTSHPFIPLDAVDPVSLSYPWVLRDPGGPYRMWYGSTVNWDAGNGEMVHIIKSAQSEDGHAWTRTGESVPWAVGEAQAFSRPTVIGSGDEGYRMWFSFRSGGGETYRIGYAESADGHAWTRMLGRAGIDVSNSGWDAEMITYPFVFEHRGRTYMLYNGNGYGKSGVGLAVLSG